MEKFRRDLRKVLPKGYTVGEVYIRPAGIKPFVLLSVQGNNIHGCYDLKNPGSGNNTFHIVSNYLWSSKKPQGDSEKLVGASAIVVGGIYRSGKVGPFEVLEVRYINEDLVECVVKTLKEESIFEINLETAYEITVEKEEKTMDNTLYQIIGTESYGTVIGTNSEGKLVLEIKGTGEIVTKDKDALEKVLPYSVGVRLSGNKPLSYYTCKKGTVTAGDIIFFDNFEYGIVSQIDCKKEGVSRELKGKVVVTRDI